MADKSNEHLAECENCPESVQSTFSESAHCDESTNLHAVLMKDNKFTEKLKDLVSASNPFVQKGLFINLFPPSNAENSHLYIIGKTLTSYRSYP